MAPAQFADLALRQAEGLHLAGGQRPDGLHWLLPRQRARRDTPSPARPLFQAAVANFALHSQAAVDTANQNRGPLLLISGTEDHTVPDVSTRSTLKQYRHSTAVTELKQFEHLGHSLTIDSGWKEVADAVLHWLHTQGS